MAGTITVDAPSPGALGTFDNVTSLGNVLSGAVIRMEVQDVSVEDGSLFAMDSECKQPLAIVESLSCLWRVIRLP